MENAKGNGEKKIYYFGDKEEYSGEKEALFVSALQYFAEGLETGHTVEQIWDDFLVEYEDKCRQLFGKPPQRPEGHAHQK